MIGEDVSDEVYNGNSDDDEQNEHGDHFEKEICKSVKQETERYLKQTDPFGALETLSLVEGKIFVCSEDVNTDRETSQSSRNKIGYGEHFGFSCYLS